MADYNDIKQSIATNLPDNNNREITAAKLRSTLNEFVDKVETTETGIEENVSDINTKITGLGKEGIYDVTVNNNGATFTSLSTLLSDENLSTLIPADVRGGGMSIRFVRSSDNRYMQYRLVANDFSTDVADWDGNDGYIIKTEVSVDNNNQRTKIYNIKPGTRIAVRVSKVSGIGSTYTLAWIKPDGNQNVFMGYPMGYMSDELVVPDDATGISIFMNPAGSGNVNLIEVFDPSNTPYIEKKLNYNIDGIEYLNNRQVVDIHTTLEVTSSPVDIFSINDGRLKNLKGDMYAFIESLAKFNNDGHIRFYFDDGETLSITGLQLRQSKLFKLGNNKVLGRISVWQDSVVNAGDIHISVFAIESPQTYLQYPLYKKNIMCFGDSLTEFESNIDGKRYSDHLQDISQANVYNAGIGGTRLASRTTLSLTPSDNQQCVAAFDIAALIQAWSTKDFSYQDAAIASGHLSSVQQTKFENKLAILKNNPIENFDIVTISGGHNDYNGGSAIGTKEYSNYDIYTVCGAINNSIKQINTANPKIQIYMYGLLPLTYDSNGTNIYSDDYIPNNAPSYNNHQLKAYEFSDIIHDVAKLNHTPFDNWYWDCGLNRYNHNEYYPIQGDTHPYYGFEYIAKKIYKFLLSK